MSNNIADQDAVTEYPGLEDPEFAAALSALASVDTLLVALDFDGTLSDIAPTPGSAKLVPGAQEAIDLLRSAPRTRVALVSGRTVPSLRNVSSPSADVLLVGSHGAEHSFDSDEIILGDGTIDTAEVALIGEILGQLSAALPGTHLEQKPIGFSLHTRGAAPDIAAIALDQAYQVVSAEMPDLVIRRNDHLIEFSVSRANKGTGLQELRDYVKPDALFYAGDEGTDEDAFAVAKPGDVMVKIGPEETKAHFRSSGPAQMVAIVTELGRLRLAATGR